jgi:hypothetical protein
VLSLQLNESGDRGCVRYATIGGARAALRRIDGITLPSLPSLLAAETEPQAEGDEAEVGGEGTVGQNGGDVGDTAEEEGKRQGKAMRHGVSTIKVICADFSQLQSSQPTQATSAIVASARPPPRGASLTPRGADGSGGRSGGQDVVAAATETAADTVAASTAASTVAPAAAPSTTTAANDTTAAAAVAPAAAGGHGRRRPAPASAHGVSGEGGEGSIGVAKRVRS